jgi:hypothetical protein
MIVVRLVDRDGQGNSLMLRYSAVGAGSASSNPGTIRLAVAPGAGDSAPQLDGLSEVVRVLQVVQRGER